MLPRDEGRNGDRVEKPLERRSFCGRPSSEPVHHGGDQDGHTMWSWDQAAVHLFRLGVGKRHQVFDLDQIQVESPSSRNTWGRSSCRLQRFVQILGARFKFAPHGRLAEFGSPWGSSSIEKHKRRPCWQGEVRAKETQLARTR